MLNYHTNTTFVFLLYSNVIYVVHFHWFSVFEDRDAWLYWLHGLSNGKLVHRKTFIIIDIRGTCLLFVKLPQFYGKSIQHIRKRRYSYLDLGKTLLTLHFPVNTNFTRTVSGAYEAHFFIRSQWICDKIYLLNYHSNSLYDSRN